MFDNSDPVSQYKDMCKEVKVNLNEEYKHHLKCMELLESLKDLQLGFDHSFFKNFVCQFIDRDDIKAKQSVISPHYNVDKLSCTADMISLGETVVNDINQIKKPVGDDEDEVVINLPAKKNLTQVQSGDIDQIEESLELDNNMSQISNGLGKI